MRILDAGYSGVGPAAPQKIFQLASEICHFVEKKENFFVPALWEIFDQTFPVTIIGLNVFGLFSSKKILFVFGFFDMNWKFEKHSKTL